MCSLNEKQEVIKLKQRVLSVALALCICISSQSVVYASDLSQQKNVLTEKTLETSGSGGEVTVAPQPAQTPSPTEDVLLEEPSVAPDSGADGTTAPQPVPTDSPKEDVLPTQTPEMPEPGAEATTVPQPAPTDLPEEGVLPTEKPEVPGPGAEATTVPQPTPTDLPEEDVLPTETPEVPEPGAEATIVPQPTPTSSPGENILPEATPCGSAAPVQLIRSLNYPLTLMTTRDSTIPTPTEVYERMIALKDDDRYKEGTTWTNYEPYPNTTGDDYHWQGGPLNGTNISAVGCVAFAFILSDTAFGQLKARMYSAGEFSYEDIKVGDILRVSNDAHTVIVLEVSDVGVVVAEGNISTGDHKGRVHWGRAIPKDEVMSNTSHYITRYPEGYISPDDPEAGQIVKKGTLDGGLAWKLTKAGTLTISGQGAMPDFSGPAEQPWSNESGDIRKVVIENGVTSIGACAFYNCGVLGAEISSSVTAIGNSAFRGSGVVTVTIPSSVKTIGDSAFRECGNLSSVMVSEGVEKIEQNAFRACRSLTSIALPASIGEVGAGTFFDCDKMTNATFAPGSKQVKLGDDMFARCYYLMNVTLPRSIDRISTGMFQNCLMLAGVEIPQGAESIGGSAFASSGVAAVVIPDSVTTIETAAFSSCSMLKNVYFTGSEAQWNSIGKSGDVVAALSKVTIHYNYTPPVSSPSPSPSPTSSPGGGDDNDDNNNPGGDNDNTPGGDNNTPGGDNDNTPGGDNDNTPGGDNNTPGGDNNNTPGGDNNTPDGDNNNTPGGGNGNNPGGDKPGNNPGGGSDGNTGSDSDKVKSTPRPSSIISSGIKAVTETWKPITPDDRKRYACMGQEAVRYTQSKNNEYQISIENAIQGPMCFKSFEAVLGDYTIGRTYNIYSLSDNTYSMDKEIEVTIEIPSAIYKENRDYKMICVTKGGKPIIYNDTDKDPRTITIKTDKFFAYALIYK